MPTYREGREKHLQYVCPLPKQAVKAVYLGVNMEQGTRDRIRAAVKETNIAVFQTRLPRTKFGLEFHQVT